MLFFELLLAADGDTEMRRLEATPDPIYATVMSVQEKKPSATQQIEFNAGDLKRFSFEGAQQAVNTRTQQALRTAHTLLLIGTAGMLGYITYRVHNDYEQQKDNEKLMHMMYGMMQTQGQQILNIKTALAEIAVGLNITTSYFCV